MIHFSALGVSKDSESWDLKTKYEGEQAVLNEFPNATIFRIAPFVSFNDDIAEVFGREFDTYFNFIPIFSNL